MNADKGVLEELVRRVASLERQNLSLRHLASRRLAAVGLVASTCLIIAVCMSASNVEDDVVTAKAFLLRDADGRLRGSFALLENGEPSFSLYSRDDVERVNIALAQNETGVMSIHDRKGTPVLLLGMDAKFSPGLRILRSQDDRPRMLLTAVDGGPVSLMLGDAQGRMRAYLGLTDGGLPSLAIQNESRGDVSVLRQQPNGKAVLEFLDGKGKPTVRYPPDN